MSLYPSLLSVDLLDSTRLSLPDDRRLAARAAADGLRVRWLPPLPRTRA